MKKLAIAAALAGFSAANFGATLYNDLNLTGENYTFAKGSFFGWDLRITVPFIHDQTTSVKVQPGECLVMTKNGSFLDGNIFFTAGTYNDLRNYSFNDVASSAAVYDPSLGCSEQSLVRLYEHPNGTGRKMLGIPPFQMNVDPIFDNKISLIIVPPGLCVRVYPDRDFKGEPREFDAGTYDLHTAHYEYTDSRNYAISVEDSISSIYTYRCP